MPSPCSQIIEDWRKRFLACDNTELAAGASQLVSLPPVMRGHAGSAGNRLKLDTVRSVSPRPVGTLGGVFALKFLQ